MPWFQFSGFARRWESWTKERLHFMKKGSKKRPADEKPRSEWDKKYEGLKTPYLHTTKIKPFSSIASRAAFLRTANPPGCIGLRVF